MARENVNVQASAMERTRRMEGKQRKRELIRKHKD